MLGRIRWFIQSFAHPELAVAAGRTRVKVLECTWSHNPARLEHELRGALRGARFAQAVRGLMAVTGPLGGMTGIGASLLFACSSPLAASAVFVLGMTAGMLGAGMGVHCLVHTELTDTMRSALSTVAHRDPEPYRSGM